MAALGIDEGVLLEAGLLARREDGTVVPRFRGRLLFPIHDLRGRVVGFGGRLLGPGEPKYLNSPESAVFHKGGTLYNLHAAKNAIRKEGAVFLVEGYFDVLRLVLAGIEHVVAPLGTALTPDQATLLRRFTSNAILLLDSDIGRAPRHVPRRGRVAAPRGAGAGRHACRRERIRTRWCGGAARPRSSRSSGTPWT